MFGGIKIDGVVITFVNITKSKVLEAELRKTKLILEQRLVEKGEELVPVNDRLPEEVQQGDREVAACIDPKRSES